MVGGDSRDCFRDRLRRAASYSRPRRWRARHSMWPRDGCWSPRRARSAWRAPRPGLRSRSSRERGSRSRRRGSWRASSQPSARSASDAASRRHERSTRDRAGEVGARRGRRSRSPRAAPAELERTLARARADSLSAYRRGGTTPRRDAAPGARRERATAAARAGRGVLEGRGPGRAQARRLAPGSRSRTAATR